MISLAGIPGGAAWAGRPAVSFPTDFGAHPEVRTEWWYVTGALQSTGRRWGFQVTFFRSATGLGEGSASRFAAQQLVFAHAALTDLAGRRQWHDQRLARSGFGIAEAKSGDTGLVLRDWHLARQGPVSASRYTTRVSGPGGAWALALTLSATQPPLLQGDAGLSRKGPGEAHVSHYYSEPQLAVSGTLTHQGAPVPVTGRAWLDHEWSPAFLPPDAVGWDWVGMNLDDGSALTAFRLRRADGTTVHAGGSFRRPGGDVRAFAATDVAFVPGRLWQSPASQARYPVTWQLTTPAGLFTVAALLDAQELDSRASTGAWYWEGLCDLRDAAGRRVGGGYLEMTGYADRLTL